MADVNALERALVNADKVGDVEAARALAAEIMRMREPAKSPMPAGMVQDPKSGAWAMPGLQSKKLDPLTALAVGAGKGVSDIGAGIKQLFGFASSDPSANKELDQRQAFMEAAYEPLKRGRPVLTAIGESLPEAGASMALTGGAGLAPAIFGSAVGAGVPSFLKYTKDTPTFEESMFSRAGKGAQSAAIGGLGGAAGYGLTRIIQPVSSTVKGASADAFDAARRVGYTPSAGQATQSPFLQNLESYFARNPGSAGRMQAFHEANAAALNRSAAKAIGENADEITEGVFSAAKNRMGAEFDRIGQLASPDVQTDLLRALSKVDGENVARGAFRRTDIDGLVEKGIDLAAQGKLTGPAYQSIRSDLGAQAASTTDATLKGALKSIQGALDDAANASLPAQEQAALAAVRKQYAALKTLMQGKVVEGGNVSAARLASALPQRGNRTAFKTGELNSDLMDIARIGESFKPPANPNSGSLLMTEAYASKPLSGAVMGALNYVPGAVYMSPAMQAYLKNKALPPLIEQGLIRSGGPAALLGLGAYDK